MRRVIVSRVITHNTSLGRSYEELNHFEVILRLPRWDFSFRINFAMKYSWTWRIFSGKAVHIFTVREVAAHKKVTNAEYE